MSIRDPERKRLSNKKWQQANPEKRRAAEAKYRKANKTKLRAARLQRKYGLTLEEYEQMETTQNGLCVVCQRPPLQGKGKRLHVDHCHKTGKVRGLLCLGCNVLVGHLENNARYIVQRALSYVLDDSDVSANIISPDEE